MQHLRTLWEEFEREVLRGASESQKSILELAFFVGADAVFTVVDRHAAKLPKQGPQGLPVIKEMYEEVEAFKQSRTQPPPSNVVPLKPK